MLKIIRWTSALLISYVVSGTTDARSVEEVMEDFLVTQGVPGVAVAAVAQTDQGLKIWTDTYGVSNLATQEPVTADTAFWMASVSKVMAGTLIKKAEEQGALTLDSKVVDILEETGAFVLGDENTTALANMTVEHLGLHRSTILDTDAYTCGYYYSASDNTTNAEGPYLLVLDLAGIDNACVEGVVGLGDFMEAYLSAGGVYYDGQANFIPNAPPGVPDVEVYSNIGCALAGYLVELTTGTDYADFAKQEILEPLGMTGSSFRLADLAGNVATPYTFFLGGDQYQALPFWEDASYPAGGLRSSANDMARFLGAIMNNGTLDIAGEASVTILEPASVADMLTIREGSEHGVFWEEFEIPFGDASRVLLGHDGADPGAASLLYFDPLTKTGFFFATNGEGSAIDLSALPEAAGALLVRADELAEGTFPYADTDAPTASPKTASPTVSSAAPKFAIVSISMRLSAIALALTFVTL